MHAASVGEVTGAMATIDVLRRRYRRSALILTVGTPAGYRFARSRLSRWAAVYPFPLDLPPLWQKSLAYFRPELFVAFESEFWPGLYRCLRRHRVPALLLNGRLSDRSARLYHRFAPLFRPIFSYFNAVVMKSTNDLDNIVSLGARRDRAVVLGSSKYDAVAVRARLPLARDWRRLLNLRPEQAVVVGGSLRGRECTGLLEAVVELKREFPHLIGLFAPRHLDRVSEMERFLDRRREPYHLLSRLEAGTEKRARPLVLIDRMGVLFELYSLGDLVFCGGTLEPVGGHNIVEPVAWGKRVYYGPHIDNVVHEHAVLTRFGAGIRVGDQRQLVERWRRRLRWDAAAGPAADPQRVLKELGGVAERQLRWIEMALGG